MMFSVYTLDNSEQWDSIVRSFADYDTYWLSGYVKAFKIHGDGEPLLFYIQRNDTRAFTVVMKRDLADCEYFKGKVPQGEWFDFATPYGYGGWIVEGSATEEIFQEYSEWCYKNNIVSEFVRFHPVVKNHLACMNGYDVVQLGEVITMELDSAEKIWENITSKNRNVIRKAMKNDVKIYNGRYPEIYEKFREIYNGTMDKDNADEYYYFSKEFYDSILNDLPENAQVFYAQIPDGTVIAASIMFAANGRMNYHLSGSLREYSSLAATNLLLYKAALWGSANGCKTLYLGGGVGSGEDSLFKFKRAFYKGELKRFHIGKKIFNQEKYDELTAMREFSEESGYFPKYRA
ncbi:MAG: GNAT family N-acetyltransferase [Ruminococcus sp.]|nr:GNAT family N-acetyltransferase [Ruminococcus sp.]